MKLRELLLDCQKEALQAAPGSPEEDAFSAAQQILSYHTLKHEAKEALEKAARAARETANREDLLGRVSQHTTMTLPELQIHYRIWANTIDSVVEKLGLLGARPPLPTVFTVGHITSLAEACISCEYGGNVNYTIEGRTRTAAHIRLPQCAVVYRAYTRMVDGSRILPIKIKDTYLAEIIPSHAPSSQCSEFDVICLSPEEIDLLQPVTTENYHAYVYA